MLERLAGELGQIETLLGAATHQPIEERVKGWIAVLALGRENTPPLRCDDIATEPCGGQCLCGGFNAP